jgi:hypothetical protein
MCNKLPSNRLPNNSTHNVVSGIETDANNGGNHGAKEKAVRSPQFP